MEKSLSTFAAEMATSAMILDLATDRSLVLVDEVSRATATKLTRPSLVAAPLPSKVSASRRPSPKRSSRRRWATTTNCSLTAPQSFTYFATHFQELAQTLCTYPGVVT